MKVNKRLLIESIMISILIVLAFLGWGIVRGMYLTKNYVPDIVGSYEAIDYLQHEISFGIVKDRSSWITVLISFSGFLFMIAAYYGSRVFLNQMIKKNRVNK
ncbi:hypothetical protein [Paenibacillus crassostreae]|nr:hypothetical protein [Paenibacillus crassostreae]